MALASFKWHHYAFTWKDGEHKNYIDGIRAWTGNSAADQNAPTHIDLGWIGYPQEKEQWHGAMADFITFNRALGEHKRDFRQYPTIQ